MLAQAGERRSLTLPESVACLVIEVRVACQHAGGDHEFLGNPPHHVQPCWPAPSIRISVSRAILARDAMCAWLKLVRCRQRATLGRTRGCLLVWCRLTRDAAVSRVYPRSPS
jgi:hypothetical protein